jgi:hypothetical protein
MWSWLSPRHLWNLKPERWGSQGNSGVEGRTIATGSAAVTRRFNAAEMERIARMKILLEG